MIGRTRLRLGTRPSVLAVAQSRLVANQLKVVHPDLEIELVQLATPGDRDRNTPLPDVSTRDFFAADLDAALLAGDVDFCVHSWKDLDADRPEGIAHVATPPRALPHDVIVWRGDVLDRLQAGKVLKIGTCSERRRLNVGDFLPGILPWSGREPQLIFTDLRGPVDQRVAQISPQAGTDRLDGVVLALAGLDRLWADSDGRSILKPLLEDVRWTVLPLSECPTAPAQGALAVECRADDAAVRQLLRAVHAPAVHEQVCKELELVGSAPVETRDRFGATVIPSAALDWVAYLRGTDIAGHAVQEISSGNTPAQPSGEVKAFIAGAAAKYAVNLSDADSQTGTANFIAHSDAAVSPMDFSAGRNWTSGVQSWRALARAGVWIEGCAEHLGFTAAQSVLQAPVLQLPPLSDWTAYTHEHAVGSWNDSGVGRVLGTYRIEREEEAHQELVNYTHFYWPSVRLYEAARNYLPQDAHHACGAGKTLDALRAAGVKNLNAFVSKREWQEWLS